MIYKNNIFCVDCDHYEQGGRSGSDNHICTNPKVWREKSDDPVRDFILVRDANPDLDCKHWGRTVKKSWWQKLCG